MDPEILRMIFMAPDGAEAGEEPTVEFEDSPEEEEMIVLRPGQMAPDEEDPFNGETPEQISARLKALQSQADTNSSLRDSILELGKTLKGNQQAPVPQQQPGETDEAFKKRFFEDLFDQEKGYGVLQEAIRRTLAPVLQQQSQATVKMQRKFMEQDPEKGEFFRLFGSEIDDFIKQLPPDWQMNPQVFDYAYQQLLPKHLNAYIEKRTVQKPVQRPRSAPAFSESRSHIPQRPAASRKVYVSQADVEAATARGLPIEEYMARKGNKR